MTWTRPRDEYEALIYIVRRVGSLHPDVDEDALMLWAAEELERFGRARLRQYVPQLVERRLRERVRSNDLRGHETAA